MSVNRIVRIVKSYDVFLNNVYFPHPHIGQTISVNAGHSQRDGETWACVLCKILNFVQKDHCEAVLDNVPMTNGALIRAGLLLALVAVIHLVVYYLIAQAILARL